MDYHVDVEGAQRKQKEEQERLVGAAVEYHRVTSERDFWEIAFCAAMAKHARPEAANQYWDCSEIADAALEEWRKRWGK